MHRRAAAPDAAEVQHQRPDALALHPPRELAQLVGRAGRDLADLQVADRIGPVEAERPVARTVACGRRAIVARGAGRG